MGWGGQLSQPYSWGQRGDPVTHCPTGNQLTAGGGGGRDKVPQGRQLPALGMLTGQAAGLSSASITAPAPGGARAPPDLPTRPPTCHCARPLLQRTKGWDSMLCPPPPPRCRTAWHHHPSRRGLCGSPRESGTPGSFCKGGVRPYANGGLGDSCRAQHRAQDPVSAASPCWGGGYPVPQAEPAPPARTRQPQSYLPFMKPSRTRSLRSESQ